MVPRYLMVHTEVEDFDVWHKAKDASFASCMLAVFRLDCFHNVLVFFGQGFEIVVGLIQLIGCQSVRYINGIEP